MTATGAEAAKLHDVALSAHDAGICVVPPRQDGTKGPLGTWKRYQTEGPTRTQVEHWYAEPDRTGIGYIGGAVSGGLELFEFEGRAVEAGLVRRFCEDAKADPKLTEIINRISTGWAEKSPSGGLHLHYRCTETGCVKLAKRADGKDLIETKGEGGYMIGAPSSGTVHPEGGAWERFAGEPATVATITPAERTLLLDHARRYHEQPATKQGHTEPDSNWQEVRSPRTGDSWMNAVIVDYNARTTWGEVLSGTFEHHHNQGNTSYWHYIGAENQVGASTNAKGTDTLIVFSGTAAGAGWDIYDGNGSKAPSYDRFSAHVLITRGRTDTATRTEVARALRQDGGYGPAPSTTTPPRNVDPETGEITTPTSRPVGPIPDGAEDLFEATETLAHVRDFARARRASPWATLGCVLVRATCAVEPFVVLPPYIGGQASLNMFLALIGRSGGGKGASEAAGKDAVDFGPIRTESVGSGEGIGHSYMRFKPAKDGEPAGWERYESRVLFRASEVDTLAALNGRQSSTLLPKLRDAWIGDDLSFSYANKEKKVPLREHAYRLGLIVGTQPDRAGVILDDADGGTPQRFLWLPTQDHAVQKDKPDTPEPLPWATPTWPVADYTTKRTELDVCSEAREAVDDAALARHRGQVDALDGHSLLARLKVAAALGILHGEASVTTTYWEMAGSLMTVSDVTRASVANTLADHRRRSNVARGEADAERTIIREKRTHEEAVRRVTLSVERKLGGVDWTPHGQLRKSLASADRSHFETAIDALHAAGRIEIQDGEYHGQPTVRYRLNGAQT